MCYNMAIGMFLGSTDMWNDIKIVRKKYIGRYYSPPLVALFIYDLTQEEMFQLMGQYILTE